jgi:hypothetical protein
MYRVGVVRGLWLVFDNFDHPEDFDAAGENIREYFPNGNGSIIFTRRHTESKDLGHGVKIAALSEVEALELLFKAR